MAQIELKAEDLYDKDKADLGTVVWTMSLLCSNVPRKVSPRSSQSASVPTDSSPRSETHSYNSWAPCGILSLGSWRVPPWSSLHSPTVAETESADLVPGDMVAFEFKIGDVVPSIGVLPRPSTCRLTRLL
ncbi:unnamed protein product [Rhizoctonia solani]|uniref:Uncharacterized protein n=1 Tax=Rhizoctonia solani TaxID=456999 RepID=A0A8H2WVA9_9AGAM|nr:unnamed protein product [Rhizoctonia solani]